MGKTPFVGLIILDGYGIRKIKKGNAIALANPSFLNNCFQNNPYTTLHASGEYVGLPKGQIGNSEVGHLNIGAGKVVLQNLLKINQAIENGSFYHNQTILDLLSRCREEHKTLHIIGLLSDGGVHSHIRHLFALIDMCQQQNMKDVAIHAFLDGRDTYRDSGIQYLQQLQKKIQHTPYQISTIMGRYYAMDRENNYDLTEIAWKALTKGEGKKVQDYQSAIQECYAKGIYDEFIPPIIVGEKYIQNQDGVLFFNFREDRARQLTRVLTDPTFHTFDTHQILTDMVTFVEYDDTLQNVKVVFPKERIEHNLSAILSKHGKKQFKITETTKYAHVTYFLNGGIEEPYPDEDRYLIETIKGKPFDAVPAMRAVEITDKAISCILSKNYDFMTLNYSNCDMIGHTGNLQATIEAIKVLDRQVQRLVNTILSIGGIAIITADHGNAEYMLDRKGRVLTDHTTNPVPFCLIGKKNVKLIKGGSLSNITPTILELMGIEEKMEQPSLIKHKR